MAFGAVALGLKLFRAEWSFLVRDPLSRSLRLLARLGVTPDPGESFMALCHRAAADRPELAEPLLRRHSHARMHAHLHSTSCTCIVHPTSCIVDVDVDVDVDVCVFSALWLGIAGGRLGAWAWAWTWM